MTIELWDIGTTYDLDIDCTDEGVNFIRISPNSSFSERSYDYDICLTKDKVEELIRVLTFIKEEIK